MYIHVKIYLGFGSDAVFLFKEISGALEMMESLLLQQAGVAGYALPAAIAVDPGIGEAAEVLVRLTLVGSFGVVNANHYGCIGVHADVDVLNGEAGWFELGIFDVGEELGFVADLAIVLGVNELAADHGIENTGVAIYLGFIPQVFHDQELGFL
jgi:hypothetical protein